MKAVVRVPDVEDNFIMPHVDADKIPAVEWNCLCAVLLPAMRQYYGFDEPDGEKGGGKGEVDLQNSRGFNKIPRG